MYFGEAPYLEVGHLLEGGAYFSVDTQRCGAYVRLDLIRGNMVIPTTKIKRTNMLFQVSNY